MKRFVLSVIAGSFACAPHAHSAPVAPKTYAQALVERETARHPELLGVAIHVSPPNGSGDVIIASQNPGELGRKSSADQLQVIATGKPHSTVTGNGTRLVVDVPLLDASSRTLGVLSVTFAYQAGADTHALESKAVRVRDELRRRISHVRNLLEPAQVDARVTLDSYAQQLLDQALDKHPDIIIMAMHATLPNTHDNVIIASNIGRIGKRADEDDMRVVDTGKPNLEVNETGDRFEAELVFKNAAGQNIGALGVVYAYKAGDDKTALQREAEQVRDELARHIPSVVRLLEPVKSAAAAPGAPLRLLGRTELPDYSG
ncbi:MAG: TonB-dependent siderophore receptor, partial [Gammaproteobacteria bacterium]